MSMIYSILIIEDDEGIRTYLKELLLDNGFNVMTAEDGITGLKIIKKSVPDLVLLDLGLPDMSGEEVLKKIREWSNAPIIILTANKTDDDKVKLLDLGADDYLVKPFHSPELLARMRVALRHLKRDQGEPILNLGDLSIDLSCHMVFVRGEEIKLTSKEYSFLKILVINAGKIVTQTQILNNIWGPNNEENSHYLRVYAGQLRKKIEEPLGKKIIITESGIGYRLIV